MKTVSVVIPTYNRCGTLQKAIRGYLNQTALESIAEILVVDDGSTDSTNDIVNQLSESSVLRIRYLRQENKGPASARNVGIREAVSSLILFTDDDIIPSPTLVAQHLDWHSRFPCGSTAVLGRVTWAAEVKPTPFMKWYGSEALFSYAQFANQTEIDFAYFYTCNLSLKSEFLRAKGGFDEEFKSAAWEDTELGFRLNKAGMRLLYNANAVAYHYQFTSFEDACRRSRKTEAAAAIFRRKEAGRSRPFHQISPLKLNLKKCLAPILTPFISLMDYRLALPQGVYRTMFRIFR